MRFSLRQLQVFSAICHSNNLTQAAHNIAISQSAASSALKELEHNYGVQLFDRVGKRLQINSLGRALRPKVESLLQRAQELDLAFSESESIGELKIGASLTIGSYLAVEAVADFLKKHPSSRVSLDVDNSAEISRKVANFELDMGMIEGEIIEPDLVLTPWLEDELVVFCSPDHAFAKRPTNELSDKDLVNSPWILREIGSGTRQAFEIAMHDLVPSFNLLLELQHTEAIKRAVEANLGIACLSKIALQEAFKRGSLIPLKVPQRGLHRRFYLIHHQQKYFSQGLSQWSDHCLAIDTNSNQAD